MEEEYGIKLKLDLSDFNKQVAKAKNSVKKVENQFRDIKITGLDDVKEIKFDTSKVDEVKDKLEEVADVKERIAKGNIKITGLEDIPGSLSEAEYEAQKLRFEMEKQKKIKMDTSGISEFRQKTEEEMNKVSYTIRDRLDAMLDVVKQKFHQIPSEVSNIARNINKSFSNINLKKKLLPDLKQIQAGFKKVKQESNGFGKNISQIATKGIKSLKRFALSLFGIQSAYRAVTKAIHSYLAYDQELSKSIQNTWAGLGSFFAPILEYLVRAFQKLLAYINALVQALTGINFVARANAKALNKMGASAGSTAKAMKQLGGFDELNNINTDSGGGAGGGGADVGQIELPEIDTSKLDVIFDIFDKIKYYASELFAPMKLAWENVGGELVNSITTAFINIKELGSTIFSSIFEVWTNGTGQQIMEDLILGWATIFNIIGNVAKSITIAWNNAGNGTKIIQNIADIYDEILKFVNDIAKTIEEWTLTPEFQEMMNTLVWMVERITYYAKKVMEYVRTKYNEWIKPVLSDALSLISSVIVMIGKIWEKAEPVFKKVGNVIKANVEPLMKNIIQYAQNFIGKIQGIVDIVTGALAGNWDKVWNGMAKVAKSVINTIINGINGLINGLNTIATPLRLVITGIAKATGKNISYKDVKIPNIPKLSIGTDEVLTEGIAYLHAGEKVIPADVDKGGYSGSDNEETNELLRQLITLIDEKDYEPYIRVDDIGSASVEYINKKKRITGEAII